MTIISSYIIHLKFEYINDPLILFPHKILHKILHRILDSHIGHVGGEAQKNILSILLWAPAVVAEQHCLVISRDWLQVKNTFTNLC